MRHNLVPVLCLAPWFALAGCGGDPETSSGPAPAASDAPAPAPPQNQAPVLESVDLRPSAPAVGDSVSVSVRGRDPEGKDLLHEIEWIHNGRRLPKTRRMWLETASFHKGDSLSAVVWSTDGEITVKRESQTLRFANAAPRVTGVRLSPAKATGNDPIFADAEATDVDNDPIEFRYAWYVNGELIEGENASTLPGGKLKRGDELRVSVAAFDGSTEGDRVLSRPVSIHNSSPRIESQPSFSLNDQGIYAYQIVAEDPDGDRPLRYRLVEGPPGMRVDYTTGEVTWSLPADAAGRHDIELSVSDAHGGDVRQTYTLELSWEEEPASPR
jgi:hypothetical protein